LVGVAILCRGDMIHNCLKVLQNCFFLIVLDIQLMIRYFTNKALNFVFNMTSPKHNEHYKLDVRGHHIYHVSVQGGS